MAINATTNWYVRTDGSATNGGGYDSGIASAGTNYCDQASPQLSLSDVVTNGTTTVTSATGGFTAAMIGNCIRITGDNYYFITAVGSSTSITVDRSTGTGTGQTGNIGGAFVSLQNLLAIGGGGAIFTAPAIASPLVAGNTINVRGSGSGDGGTVDYDWSGAGAGFWGTVNGSSSGRVTLLGYNGRPFIKTSGLLINGVNYWNFHTLKFQQASGASYRSLGLTNSSFSICSAIDCIMDLNGNDGIGFMMQQVESCEIRNTGGGAAGTGCGVQTNTYAGAITGNYIHGLRGDGIQDANGSAITRNLIVGCGRDGIRSMNAGGITGNSVIENNTCDSNTGAGINVTTTASAAAAMIRNNLLTGNTGKGLDFSTASATTAVNDSRKVFVNYNAYWNNTGGKYGAISAGANDVDIGALANTTPYVNSGSGNYGLNSTTGAGAACRAAGFPGAFPVAGTTTGYLDIGAVQHQDSGGGGSTGLPAMVLQANTWAYVE